MDIQNFTGKKVLIMGLGVNGGGVESAKFFSHLGSIVTVTDLQDEKVLQKSLNLLKDCKGITYHLGEHIESDFIDTDIVIKNPGVPPTSKYLQIAKNKSKLITSDLEVFLQLAKPKKIIAITGTKGKSTTATFISQILDNLNIPNILVGNIGKSPLNSLGMEKDKYVVLELSSFQIDDLGKNAPYFDVIVITNIFPDHLNRYGSFNNYQKAKLNLFNYLKPNGSAVLPQNSSIEGPSKINKTIFFTDKFTSNIFNNTSENILNFNAALLSVSELLELNNPDQIIPKIKKLNPPRFRNEVVRKLNNIYFINDSTATNPTVAVSTLKNYSAKNSIAILGGSSKDLPIGVLADFINGNDFCVILLKTSVGQDLSQKIKKSLIIATAETLEEAINSGYKYLKKIKGTHLILSPGAASFGMFVNEFDRGEQFNYIVSNLK